MKRLLTLGIPALLFLGCKTPQNISTLPLKESWAYDHYFMQGNQRLLFKTRMRLAKEEFSGLLIVKQTDPQTYRGVFTTETGFKIFDLSIHNDGYEMNYGVGPIEKKFIAVRLAYTLQALLLRPFPGILVIAADSLAETGRFYSPGKQVYTIKKLGPRAQNQTVALGKKVKAAAHFSDYGDDDLPDSATVTHFGFPLTASFRFLKQ